MMSETSHGDHGKVVEEDSKKVTRRTSLLRYIPATSRVFVRIA